MLQLKGAVALRELRLLLLQAAMTELQVLRHEEASRRQLEQPPQPRDSKFSSQVSGFRGCAGRMNWSTAIASHHTGLISAGLCYLAVLPFGGVDLLVFIATVSRRRLMGAAPSLDGWHLRWQQTALLCTPRP